MRILASVIALFALAACGGGGSGGGSTLSAPALPGTTVVSSSSNAGGATAPATIATSNNRMATLLNGARTANGQGTVTFNSRLQTAAQIHADDMLANGFFSHTGSDGSSVAERARRAGYNWNAIGENLGRGQQSELEIHQGWMGSPGHRANNLNPNFEEFGLAQAGTGAERRWVLVLGREQQ